MKKVEYWGHLKGKNVSVEDEFRFSGVGGQRMAAVGGEIALVPLKSIEEGGAVNTFRCLVRKNITQVKFQSTSR